MTTCEPLVVVVVDNVCRLALYVWRYLSGNVGFGIGDIDDRASKFSLLKQDALPRPLVTPAGEAVVWWVDTREENWLLLLEGVLERIKGGNRCFLVDARGPYGPSSSGGPTSGGAGLAVQKLEAAGVRVRNDLTTELLLVSSYQSAPYPIPRSGENFYLRVFPKSPETLEILRRRLPRPAKDAWETSPCAHILVTGAGFELRDGGDPVSPLGTTKTEIVMERITASEFGDSRDAAIARVGYSFPMKYASGDSANAQMLRSAAMARNLDGYWDALLALELEEEMRPFVNDRPNKVKASKREYDLRDAFRRQFLDDDWGFLRQAVDALEIGLEGWLTTNYTRFADRAIDLRSAPGHHYRRSAPGGGHDGWRVVATANEANRLLQEILQAPDSVPPERHLFKLHGDIAHLLTMAVAGHDKELFSPLSLPIDSLHPVYTAAERWLIRSLNFHKGKSVFWHIVGHGLWDGLLVNLMKNVTAATGLDRHFFLLIDDGVTANPEVRLPLTPKRRLRLTATQYMARLLHMGPPPPSLKLVDQWIQRIEEVTRTG